jgi:hypothetical protein
VRSALAGRVGGPQQRTPGAVAVLDIRCNDVNGQEQAEGVGDDEPLAALDLLARVETPGRGWHRVGRANGLPVDQPRARLSTPVVRLPDLAPQRVADTLDRAVVVPPREVPSRRPPFGPVLGGSNASSDAHCSSPRLSPSAPDISPARLEIGRVEWLGNPEACGLKLARGYHRLGKEFKVPVPDESIWELHGTERSLVRVNFRRFEDVSRVLDNLGFDLRVRDPGEELAVYTEAVERRDVQAEARRSNCSYQHSFFAEIQAGTGPLKRGVTTVLFGFDLGDVDNAGVIDDEEIGKVVRKE